MAAERTSTIAGRCTRLLGGVFAALLALCVNAVAAEDFNVAVQGRQLTMELAGHIVSVPGPVWTSDGDTTDVEKTQFVYRPVSDGVETVLLLPFDETLVTWTRIMGIVAVAQPGYLAAYHAASMIETMGRDCAPGNSVVSKIPAASKGALEGLLLMCGRYRPTRQTSHTCPAGIIIAVVLQSPQGAARVYYEWCTPTFDIRNAGAWPVTGAEMQTRATELQESTAFVPIKAPVTKKPVDAGSDPASEAAPPSPNGQGPTQPSP